MKKKQITAYLVLSALILVSFLPLSCHGQNHSRPQQRPLNIGFKIGLNALSSTKYKAYTGDIDLINTSHKNEPGYSAQAFFRINLDHFFMQPEIEWNLYKQTFSFSTPTAIESGWTAPYVISHTTQSAGINILVGYSIIKNGPYVFNAYAGPSFKYGYYSKFEYPNHVFQSYGAHYNPYGIVGLSFSISKFFVDIRYEIGIMNTDIDFNDISSSPSEIKNVFINKNENVLIFSCGMFF